MKSAVVAYLLWFFLGWSGAHRFYLARRGSAATILVPTLVSIPLTFVLVGFLTWMVAIVWLFVDLFLIPGMTEAYNRELAARMG
jgi:TM2 domain-containing membrane protein YozV